MVMVDDTVNSLSILYLPEISMIFLKKGPMRYEKNCPCSLYL